MPDCAAAHVIAIQISAEVAMAIAARVEAPGAAPLRRHATTVPHVRAATSDSGMTRKAAMTGSAKFTSGISEKTMGIGNARKAGTLVIEDVFQTWITQWVRIQKCREVRHLHVHEEPVALKA